MIPYRVAQVWRLLRRRPTEQEATWVRGRLTRPQQALFFAQEPGDQAHAIEVARRLEAQGGVDEILIGAALLHDVGKAPGVALPYRILVVLLARLAPGWLRSLSPERHGLLAPLARAVHHPEIGARYAAAAGSAPEVVALIRHHQRRRPPLEAPLAARLARLQAVDDAS